MTKIEDVFFELLEVTKEYVSESDYSELYEKMLIVLSQHHYNIETLYGEDELIDEVIDSMLEKGSVYDDEEDEYE